MKIQISQNKSVGRPRQGTLLLEVVVSAALLGTLLVIVSQAFVQLRTQTKLVERRVVAQNTLENLLEDFSARGWQEVTSDSIGEIKLPDWVSLKLPQAKISGAVTLEQLPVESKHIVLQLTWSDDGSRMNRPLSLATWVYHSQKEER